MLRISFLFFSFFYFLINTWDFFLVFHIYFFRLLFLLLFVFGFLFCFYFLKRSKMSIRIKIDGTIVKFLYRQCKTILFFLTVEQDEVEEIFFREYFCCLSHESRMHWHRVKRRERNRQMSGNKKEVIHFKYILALFVMGLAKNFSRKYWRMR